MKPSLPVKRHIFSVLKFALQASFAVFLLTGKLFAQAPVISYSSPQTYRINTAISPLSPASTGGVAASPGYSSPVVLGSGLQFSQNGVALDAAGNIYTTDDNTSGLEEVLKIAADGSSTTAIGSGFTTQSSNVAVDPAGNVYVADQSRVWKIPANGSPVTYGAPVVISTAFSRPFGIATDLSGNVYVSDLTNGGVYKMANDGTNKTRIDNGLTQVAGLAVDAAGNVYASTISDLALYEIPANGNPQVKLATGLAFPRGLAVDAGGTIYIDDEGLGGIYTVPPGGGAPVAAVPNLIDLVGVAVDANYNLYAALQGYPGINKFVPTGAYFIAPALPAGLTINATSGAISGTPTAGAPVNNYTVTAFNASGFGTAPINITVYGPPPVIGYGAPQVYTDGTAITPLVPTSTGATVSAPGYSNALTTISSGFGSPSGVATDAAGNVYVADKNNNDIIKLPAGGGSPVTITANLNAPLGIAVDQSGNIYVADSQNGLVKEISADLSTVTQVGSGFTTPIGVALDASGNLFVADIGSNTISEITKTNGTQSLFATGLFTDLSGIAVDASGNVYATDEGSGTLYKFTSRSNMTLEFAAMFSFPTGVAVTPSGDIFVSAGNGSQVYEIPMGNAAPVAVGTGFAFPAGVAVDGAGNIYASDAGPNVLYKVTPSGGYYASQLPQGLRINDTTGAISGTPKMVSAATNYTVTAYANGTPGTATANIAVVLPPVPAISYQTPQTYTAGTAISPLSPSDAGGPVDFPAYSTTFTQVGSGYNTPGGVALDAAGNVFVADAGRGQVEAFAAGTGALFAIYTGFNYPTGVTLDATGDIFVADQGGGQVYEITFGTGTPVSIGTFSGPNSVTVDAAGNVFVTDDSAGTVNEIQAGNPTPIALVTGLLYPDAITNDGAGNLYFVDGGQSAVFKLPETGGTPLPISDNFIFPTAITIDASGSLYITDADADVLYKLSANGFSQTELANGFNNPNGVAIDGAGNLYVGDSNNNAVDEITPIGGYYINAALPIGLTLSSRTGTISGTPLVGSPATNYTITGYNPAGGSAAIVNITVTIPPPPTLSYAGPQQYPVGITITPLVPVSSGVSAPQYNPAISSIGTGFTFPLGVAVDRVGDLFVADAGNNAVYVIPVGSPTVKLPVGPGPYNAPGGVAIDKYENLYIADSGDGLVIKIPVGGGTPVDIGGTGYFNYPQSVAVDSTGNVYVADPGLGKLIKVPNGTGTPRSLGTFSYPAAVAVDAAGNIYTTDLATGRAYEIPVGGGTQVQVGGIFNAPEGIAVDASGNVYISDAAVGRVKEYPSGGGAPITIGGLNLPYGVAVDGAGHVYAGDVGNKTIDVLNPIGGYFVTPAVPAGLTFNTTSGTISGTPTAGTALTTYTFTGYNPGGSGTANAGIQVITSNSNLTKLVPGRGVLSPGFVTATTSYTATYPNSISSITLTPTTSDPGATVTINGTAVASGSASASIPIRAGLDTINTVVTSSDQTTTTTYSLVTTRTPSNNSALANIVLSNGSLSPAFSASKGGYATSVGYGLTTMTITPTAADSTATITVNGVAVTSGTASGYLTLAVGNNPVTIVVTAQNGTNKTTYTLNVNEARSLNDYLSSFATSAGLAQGVTVPNTLTENVPNAATSITVTPTVQDVNATVTVNGAAVTSGSPSAPINLAVGQNTITTIVTAQNGVTNTYTLTVTRALPTNANLSNLQVSNGSLSPAFGTATNFIVYVGNGLATMTVTPTAADPLATIKVNGTAVATGTASTYLPLVVGANTVSVVVTAQDGVTTKTYTVVINEARSLNNNLLSFKTSAGLSQGLTVPTTLTESVPFATSSITITPTVQDATATVTVNSATVMSGSTSTAIGLNVGANTITTVVTAQSGVTKTYTLTVTRGPDPSLSNLVLSNGTLSPAFVSATTAYTTSIGNGVTTMTVTPTTSDPNATVTVNGNTVASGSPSGHLTLVVGNNTVTIVVTAADGTTKKTYTLVVNEARSSNANLLTFQPSTGVLSPTFTPGTTSYTASVPNTTASITVKPTVADATATVKVNNATVASGTQSASIPLSVGPNTITGIVTAQSGVTKTYTITITRAAPPSDITVYEPVGVQNFEPLAIADEGINVHQGLSPNGDGINDYLQIDNISNYPDNNLKIMTRNGQLIFEAKGYDNATKVFDGHSNKTGQMQLPGTYFYELDYVVKGVTRQKTGYLVLKY